MSIASWTSPPASAFTFPISRVIRSVSSPFCARRSSAKRKSMLPRSGAGTRRQSSNAAFAFCTAASTSAAVERGKVASTSPVAGTTDSNVCAIARRLLRRVCVRKGSGHACATTLTNRAAFLELGARELVAPVRPMLAAIDDHRHVRVLLVVRKELVVELALELLGHDAIDHLCPSLTTGLEPRNVRNDPSVLFEPGVPLHEGPLELGRILAPLGEAHRRRVGHDAVLVPGDVPRDGDDDVGVHAGERDDRHVRNAEALRDPADRAAVLRGVEAVGRVDEAELCLGEAAENRLARDRRIRARLAEQRPEREAAAAAVGLKRRRRRRALLVPAVLESRLLAELADVDEAL